jgi:hypothetical protein
MTTLVEDLKRSIAQLEEEAPSSRLLKDFREQLAAIEYSDGKTAEQLYYSGNPVVPTSQPEIAAKKLPDAPTRDQFRSQEEFEEARGYWQSHVGRIKAMVDLARRSKDSPAE